MKRVGYITDKDGRRIALLEAMGDYGNVQKAYNKARKCKRHRKDVLIFTKDKEENLDKVREDIINLAYEPSKYHYFKVYEPKERQIMALPFYDRVVQHAILSRSARAGKSQKSSYKRAYRAGRDTQDTPTATTYERK